MPILLRLVIPAQEGAIFSNNCRWAIVWRKPLLNNPAGNDTGTAADFELVTSLSA
jgi:hypothetical protein